MKAVVATFNQEKALVGAFSVIKNLQMELLKHYCACVTLWTRSVVMQVTTQARSIVTTVRLHT